eukprot:497829_1
MSNDPTVVPSESPSRYPTVGPSEPPSNDPTVTKQRSDSCTIPKDPTGEPSGSPSNEQTTPPSESASYDFKECVKDFALSDDESISIDIDTAHKKMRITLYITPGVWFGIGFGNKEMSDTSGITVSDPTGEEIHIDWRIFGDHIGGDLVDDYTFELTEKVDIAASRVVSVVCDWDAVSNYAIYSFTDFFECNANMRILSIIWAKGFDENFGYHGEDNRRNDLSLTSCNCDEEISSFSTQEPSGRNHRATIRQWYHLNHLADIRLLDHLNH